MWCRATSRVCRLLDLVVSPGLLSLSGDLTTRTVAIYAYIHMYSNINNDNLYYHINRLVCVCVCVCVSVCVQTLIAPRP